MIRYKVGMENANKVTSVPPVGEPVVEPEPGEISSSTSDSDLIMNPAYAIESMDEDHAQDFYDVLLSPIVAAGPGGEAEAEAEAAGADASEGNAEAGADAHEEEVNISSFQKGCVGFLNATFTLFSLFISIWFLTQEEGNPMLFGYAVAQLSIIALRCVRKAWAYLGKNHYPRLLAGTRRIFVYNLLLCLSWILDLALAIYLWSQIEAISVDGGGVSSITRSFLEVAFYINIVAYSFIGLGLLLIILVIIIAMRVNEVQREEAGAVPADSQSIAEKTYVQKISQMAKEILETAPNCMICMEDYELEDQIRKLGCGHFYHEACIDEWLRRSKLCPYCRQPIGDAQDLHSLQDLQSQSV